MTRRWVDPRTIDWWDGLNPLRVRSYRRKRYFSAALSRPLFMALRTAPGLALLGRCAPDRQLAPGGVFEGHLELPAVSWIIALSATSDQPEGFSAQITNPATGATLWPRPAASVHMTGAPQYFLPVPWPIVAPDDAAVVRIENLSQVNPNNCQLLLWIVHEEGA